MEGRRNKVIIKYKKIIIMRKWINYYKLINKIIIKYKRINKRKSKRSRKKRKKREKVKNKE
jgi:hypothetical protein